MPIVPPKPPGPPPLPRPGIIVRPEPPRPAPRQMFPPRKPDYGPPPYQETESPTGSKSQQLRNYTPLVAVFDRIYEREELRLAFVELANIVPDLNLADLNALIAVAYRLKEKR